MSHAAWLMQYGAIILYDSKSFIAGKSIPTIQHENLNFLNFLGIKFKTNRSQCWIGSNPFSYCSLYHRDAG